MTATDILRRHRRLRPNEPAVLFEETQLTWAQLDERVNRAANALLALGVKKGDRVAVLSFNCNQFVELYFASGKIGSVTTPLNFRLGPAELEYIINDSEAVALMVGEELVGNIAPIKTLLPTVRQFICIGGRHEGYLCYEDWIAGAPADPPPATASEEDLIWQMYTSGTTGRPKGAMITHRALMTNVLQCIVDFPISGGDRLLIVAPVFHAAATINAMCGLAMGGTIVIKRFFNPIEVLGAFQNEGITHALLVPAMIQFLLAVPGIEEMEFGRLEYVLYGASPIPVEILKKAMRVFKCKFAQGFGQTESVAVLTMLKPEDHVLEGPPEVMRRLQSCGRELFGCEVRVVKQGGEEAQPGEVGEIVARGENVMKGYWKMPEATAEALRDGWLHTGDLGTMDERGYVYLVDRLKDMIVSGGENVYPREIEEVLFAHPAVADAAVIGVPSERWGEEVKALAVLKPGQKATETELIEFCRERLAAYKCPRSVDFRDELPKNPSGKTLKRELREPYWQGRERRVN